MSDRFFANDKKTLIFVYFDNNWKKCPIDLFKRMLTFSSSYCLLIPKMLTLMVRLSFEKKAFAMSSFQYPLQELGHYIQHFPLICIYFCRKITFYINCSDKYFRRDILFALISHISKYWPFSSEKCSKPPFKVETSYLVLVAMPSHPTPKSRIEASSVHEILIFYFRVAFTLISVGFFTLQWFVKHPFLLFHLWVMA